MAAQIKLSYKVVNKAIVTTVEGKKLNTNILDPKKMAKAIEAIEAYNKRNSKEKLNKVLAFFKEKAEKAKEKKTIEKKIAKRELKTIKKNIKEETKKLKAGDNTVDSTNEKILLNDKRFLIKNKNVYLRPFIEIAMPTKLVEKVVACLKEKVDVTPYIKFWQNALLNPNPIARTKLFDYLSRHNLIVTPNGYFVTFRMVKKTNTPGVFTSAHTQKEKYIIGEAYRIPRSQCDEDGKAACSRGLHTGSSAFIGIEVGDGYGAKVAKSKVASPNTYGTGYDNPANDAGRGFNTSFGNQAVICLVNPMHVVSIPFSDTRKMRSCELFFVKLTTAEEVIDLTEKDYLIYDVQYKEFEDAEILKMLDETKLQDWIDDSSYKGKSKAILEALEARKKAILATLNIGRDKPNSDLSLAQINEIIKTRLKK